MSYVVGRRFKKPVDRREAVADMDVLPTVPVKIDAGGVRICSNKK